MGNRGARDFPTLLAPDKVLRDASVLTNVNANHSLNAHQQTDDEEARPTRKVQG